MIENLACTSASLSTYRRGATAASLGAVRRCHLARSSPPLLLRSAASHAAAAVTRRQPYAQNPPPLPPLPGSRRCCHTRAVAATRAQMLGRPHCRCCHPVAAPAAPGPSKQRCPLIHSLDELGD